MPMSFPDEALARAAEVHNFRAQIKGESFADYRKALADHVMIRDYIESCEIRFGVGWDQFTDVQNAQMISRNFL